MTRTLVGFVSLLLLLAGSVSAQDVSGHLEGRVVSEDALPVSLVDVEIVGPRGASRVARTDLSGRFRFASIPVGSYVVTVSGPTIQTVRIEGAAVTLGQRTVLGPISVPTAAFELEPLVITADATQVDRASMSLGTTIVTAQVATLPLGRDYQSTLALLPHANTSYLGDGVSVGGSTGLDNLYFVDGVNVTAPYQANRSTNLPYNFVSQLRVRKGGYSVRDGGALGAVVDAVTHTGGNDFELEAFGFFTNQRLSADGRVGLRDLEERHFETYDIGVRLSGPLVADRLWYSVAFNPLVEVRERKALNLDFFQDRRIEHRVAGKLTWRPRPDTDVEATVFGDPTGHDRVAPFSPLFTTRTLSNPDPFLWRREEGAINAAIHAVHRWSDGTLKAAFARSTSREHSFGRTETARSEPFFHDPSTGQTEGGVLWDERVDGRRSSLSLETTLFAGRHTWTFGGVYAVDEIDYRVDQPEPGLVLASGGLFFQQLFRDAFPNLRNRAPAIYVEDRWELTNRLVVTAGIRWETQALIATGDSVAQSFGALWQPRVGVSYGLDRMGRHKLFASAGRFYQRIPLQGAVFFYSEPSSGARGFPSDPRSPGATPIFELPPPRAAAKVDDVEGEHHDQLVVGWDGRLHSGLHVTARGVFQSLRQAWIGAVEDPLASNWTVGNPGNGTLDFMPAAKRHYRALELSVARSGEGPLDVRASYVFSKSDGNYSGLFSSDQGVAQPNNNWTFRCPASSENSRGLLPNDRPHVFKLLTSYLFGSGATGGAFFTAQSGTPLSEFAHDSGCFGSPPAQVLAEPRGSGGRLPWVWDLDIRVTAPVAIGSTSAARVIVDLLNVGNPRQVVVADQLRWPAGGAESPTYGVPLAYQPPMMLRVGFEFGM